MSATLPPKPAQSNEASGNRCGHVPGAPVFYTDQHQASKLGFLATLQYQARRLYWRNDWRLWTGRRRRRSKDSKRTRIAAELHDRPRPRSELREAIVTVLQYLAQFVQVKDHVRVLRFKNKEGVSRDMIVKATGLSLWRVREAIQVLKDCGYIGGFQPRDNKDGKYRGRPAIRWVTYDLFRALDIWRAFRKVRESFKMCWPPPHLVKSTQPVRAFAGGVRPHRRI